MIEIAPSLRTRLALWLVAGAVLLGIGLLIDAWLDARAEATRAYDAQLDDAVLAIADDIRWEDGEAVVSIPAAALRILSTKSEERVFYAVFDGRGHRLASNLDLPIKAGWQTVLGRDGAWYDLRYQNVAWRVHGRPFNLAGWHRRANLQIWVGQTENGRRALAWDVFKPSIVRFAILILAAAVLGALAIASALAPLARLRERLRRRAPDDLTPLDWRVPRELGEFARTLDRQLAGQRESRATLLRLTADASHQLRTPLAGLRTSAETALSQDDPNVWHSALERIRTAADRTSRLADQLLHMARLRHTGGDDQEELDLAVLAAETLLDWVDRAEAAAHDLGFNSSDAPCPVRGQPWALRALIGNLIDNALRYTPGGTAITVAVEPNGDTIRLSVVDDGPGVPESRLATLHQAFDRGQRHDDNGSGLGLAIAHTVANNHSAAWHIANRPIGGLLVAINFPAVRTNRETDR